MYGYDGGAGRNAAVREPRAVAFAQGDVTGDRVPDQVYLTGVMTPDSPFIQQITLVVRCGRTGRVASQPLRENAGYNPRLFLGDFTGNKVDDILISIDTGGSGATMYHYVFSYLHLQPALLFDGQAYNEQVQNQYQVTYLDGYRVRVRSLSNNKTYILDLSGRDPDYLNEIYEPNGKLKQPVEGFVNPLSGMYPVDFDGDGTYELLAYQKIAGLYNADALGYIQNTLKWKGNRFVLDQQAVAIQGF